MISPACVRFQEAVFAAGGHPDQARDTDAAHHEACADCREWLASFQRGLEQAAGDAAFAPALLERLGHDPCTRARHASAAGLDEPVTNVEQRLVAAHLTTCPECRLVIEAMPVALAALPALADLDPGPGFTAHVLAATSRRPLPGRALDRWRHRWDRLVDRPRFAIEGAYALSLCLLLVTGNPLSAVEWTAARVEPLVERAAVPAAYFDAGVQALRQRAVVSAQPAPAGRTPAADLATWARQLWARALAAMADGLLRALAAIDSATEWIRQRATSLLTGLDAAAAEPDRRRLRSTSDIKETSS